MTTKNLFARLRDVLRQKKKSKAYTLQLTSDEIESMRLRLQGLIANKKPYLQKGYHIRDLADDLEIPMYQLSAFMNRILGISFSDYMNRHRIIYCEELILAELGTKMDLDDLAKKCGFNNRNSFTAAFKKFTGRKPFEYIKSKHSQIRPG
jgi:YesN/AraC family two-component response regulator